MKNPASDDGDPVETVDEDALQNAETETVEPAENEHHEDTGGAKPPKQPNILQKLLGFYKTKKKIAIPLTVVAFLALLLAVPVTRYAVLGLVMKKDMSVRVLDSQTSIPVSGADVTLRGKSAKTDGQGNATLKGVKVGKGKLVANKKYYKDSSLNITVPVTKLKNAFQLKLEATGRQVPVHVTNKITGQDVAGVTVKAADTEVQTDKNGAATLVVPANESKLPGTISSKGYNSLAIELTVSQTAIKENSFAVTPSGKVYFLSKKSGKIDVVKTDLDGSNRQTVLAGTGQEEDTNTVLLASRDWKYLALQSRRDSDKSKLYLIDTSNDKLTEMDSGGATFTPVGWHDHYFIYQVNRSNALVWQPKANALKTYNAENQQLNVLDETNAEGSGDNDYAAESIDQVYILKDNVVYTKHWNASYYSVYRLSGKRMGIYSVKANGSSKQTIKDFDTGNNGYISAVLSKPTEIYFSVSAVSTSYYEYADGAIKETKDINGDSFYKFYPTYLASPSGQNTFWYEPRDGKNTLFIGTTEGGNPKEIASLSEYIPYGWYTDDYLLASKGGSELFILPVDGPGDKGQVLKVSDYHKPNVNFQGYGGGYGGF